MGEGAVEFGCEKEIRIDCGHFAAPELAPLRLQGAVKRSVDLGGVEETRQIFQRMLLAVLHARGIENSVPVFVRPSSGADADSLIEPVG